jgi:hypothetical protein
MSRPKRIITEQEKQKIVADYKAGVSLKKLQKETKLQQKQLKFILDQFDVPILTAYETQRRKAMLEERNYFDELDALQCYVLGLIFGDGCVHYNPKRYKYATTIVSNDMDILESARHLLGTNFPITKRKKAKAYNLVINSKHLCQELINKFHLQSPKSSKLIFPNLPQDMYQFFVSGLLSTDGCVRIDDRRKNQSCGIEFSYSSNCLDFVQKLRHYLSNTLDIAEDGHIKTIKRSKKRKNPNYSLRYSGTNATKILTWIYENTSPITRCQRKYDIYRNHLACVSNSII